MKTKGREIVTLIVPHTQDGKEFKPGQKILVPPSTAKFLKARGVALPDEEPEPAKAEPATVEAPKRTRRKRSKSKRSTTETNESNTES